MNEKAIAEEIEASVKILNSFDDEIKQTVLELGKKMLNDVEFRSYIVEQVINSKKL